MIPCINLLSFYFAVLSCTFWLGHVLNNDQNQSRHQNSARILAEYEGSNCSACSTEGFLLHFLLCWYTKTKDIAFCVVLSLLSFFCCLDIAIFCYCYGSVFRTCPEHLNRQTDVSANPNVHVLVPKPPQNLNKTSQIFRVLIRVCNCVAVYN